MNPAWWRIPFVQHVRSAQPGWWRRDLAAGLVLTGLLAPAGMAYAAASGLPPVNGLYASIIPLVVYALVGPSRILVVGPDSALTPLIAAAVLPTLLRPSLRLLTAVTAISPSVQRGDLVAFAMNYAAAAQRMAQGLKPGQCAYFTMASTSMAKSAESVEPAEEAEATEEQEPSEPQRKRARPLSSRKASRASRVPLGGREPTVA
jgi:hypothetical protein